MEMAQCEWLKDLPGDLKVDGSISVANTYNVWTMQRGWGFYP